MSDPTVRRTGSIEFPPQPQIRIHKGRYVVLEPLAVGHIDGLWAVAQGADQSWAHLRFGPFPSRDAFAERVSEFMARQGQPFWAVRPQGSAVALGWLSYC